MSQPVNLLIVDDSESDAKLALRALRREGIDVQFERVESGAEMAAALQRQHWDAVVSDYSMPGFTGLDALGILKASGLDIPFLLVSGAVGEETAVAAMKAGASDYVMKKQLARLGPALKRELQEAANRAAHRNAQRDLVASERRLRAIIETEPECVKVVGADGQLLEMNPAGLAMLEAGSLAAVQSRPLLDFLLPKHRAAFLALHQRVMRGESGTLEFEVTGLRGGKRWLETHATPLRDANGRVVSLLGVTRDITERKRADQLLRLEHAVTRSLAASDSVLGAVESVLRAICETEGWECGRYFHLDQEANVLRFGVAWGVPEANAQRFIAGWRDVTYTPGVGLPGYVWQTAQPLWVADGDKDPRASRPKLGRDTGMHSAFFFPILSEGKTIGVMAFNSPRVREPDERLLQSIGAIGSQIGQFLQRIRAEQVMRESEERFRSLTALSSDWYWEQDEQLRFVDRHAETGSRSPVQAERFGKTRWDIPGADVNSAQWAEHRATLEKRLPFRNFEYGRTSKDGVWRYVSISGTPIFDDSGRFKGYRGVGVDITQRKQADERIRRLNRVYAVLSGINSAIVRVQNRNELFAEACRIAVAEGEFVVARVVGLDRSGKARLEATTEPGATVFDEVLNDFNRNPDTAQSLLAQVLRTGQAAISNDIASDPLVYKRAELARDGSYGLALLPLTVESRVAGALILRAKAAGMFDAEEMRLLNELAGDISFALDKIGQAEQLQVEAAERLRAEEKVLRLNRVYAVLSGINAAIVRVNTKEELFKEACRIAGSQGGFPVAWIAEVDRAAMLVRPVAGHGSTQEFLGQVRMTFDVDAPGGIGVVGQAVRDLAPVISNDTAHDPRITAKRSLEDDTGSLAVLPLVVGSEARGVLVLHAEVAGFFDEDEMKLLRELAADIGFALDHIEKANRLDYLAYYDSLTGLANRTLFHERLGQHLHAPRQGGSKLALVLLDVERFKTINDSLGRQAGDELLKQLATRLAQAADAGNVARTGVDHFAIVLPVIKGRSEAARTIERIWRECFAQSFPINGTELRITAKSGIALFPGDGADAETLYAHAESALQQAKETGERHLFHSSELTAGVANQFALENRLRLALENDEFVLYYQPKIDSDTREIAGVEALIRWQNPELGLVPPLKFIPLMEETGLILEVGAWALKRASLDHRSWFEQGLMAPRVAVNVSPIQLRQRDFVSVVEQAISGGVAPTGIDLEVTESLIMEDVQGNIAKLKAARGLGMSIAIDDFGTGYSSLGYLAKLPVQTLKIDRSFIITMLQDPDTMSLVQTIISLAHSMRLKVVAEGVESEEQAKMLRLLRCDEMQGYLFSKPVPFEQLTVLLQNGKQG